MILRFLINYAQRHQHPVNQGLHLIALPLTFVAPAVCLVHGQWLAAGLAFVGGYGLQFWGHAIEGNDAGEAVLIKKWLGLPYVAVVPRAQSSAATNAVEEPLPAARPRQVA